MGVGRSPRCGVALLASSSSSSLLLASTSAFHPSFIHISSLSVTFNSSHLHKMVARLFATSTRTALKAAKANLALNRGLATAAPAVGKVK